MSTEWVRTVIVNHPELAINLQKGKATEATQNQITALCGVIDAELSQNTPIIPLLTSTDFQQSNNEPTEPTEKLEVEVKRLQARIAALEAENGQLKADKAAAEARAEERKARIEELQAAQKAMIPQYFLTEAKENAEKRIKDIEQDAARKVEIEREITNDANKKLEALRNRNWWQRLLRQGE